jgi:WD40 repeat protein
MSFNPEEAGSTGDPNLLFAAFNQDSGCFAAGTTDGFAVFNVDPHQEIFRRVFANGGIAIVEMLFRCNLLAIVGGGRNPRYPPNKVMIWDDHENKCIGELMFKSQVHAVRMRRDRIVVVLLTKVFVYRFKDLKLLHEIKTAGNPRGLVSQSVTNLSNVLAMPGPTRGAVRVELFDLEKATMIKAHDAELAQLALNYDGTRLATSSEKGTLIRVWDTHTGEPLRELRRGTDRAEIYCIAFNPTTSFLACSSDKGTVHIFSLNDHVTSASKDGLSNTTTPPKSDSAYYSRSASMDAASAATPGTDYHSSSSDASQLSANKGLGLGMGFLRKILPEGLVPKYFASEWSYAQVRGIEGKSICAFVGDSSKIAVVCADGSFILSEYGDGGDCPRLAYSRFTGGTSEV